MRNGRCIQFFCVLIFSVILIGGCQNNAERTARRERASRPHISIEAQAVFIRRVPAADVRIAKNIPFNPEYPVTVQIDDIPLPLNSMQAQVAGQAFVQWEQLRQQALDHQKLTVGNSPLSVQPTPLLEKTQQKLVQAIPELDPYRISFTALEATWR